MRLIVESHKKALIAAIMILGVLLLVKNVVNTNKYIPLEYTGSVLK